MVAVDYCDCHLLYVQSDEEWNWQLLFLTMDEYQQTLVRYSQAWPLEGKIFIGQSEITKHNIQWCESKRLLVLINTLQYWQGRSFKPIGPKYLSHGLKPLTTYGKSDTIVVLVEDILSAIKVSRLENTSSIPLMGSSVSSDFEKQIVGMNKDIYIWLDRDKAKQAVRIKNRFKGLGCNAKVIITDKDPKDYLTQEISKWLKNK